MKSLWSLTASALKETLRQPSYVVTTLIFPAMFFWFFGVPNARDAESSQLLTASFACFAVLGVFVFQMTVGVAQERASHWSQFQRVWPVPSICFVLARVAASGVLAMVTAALVLVTGKLFTEWDPTLTEALLLLAYVLVAGLPFAALGMLLGCISSARASVPIANLVYLPLSFAGGLWIPPNALSDEVQAVSEWLPTRAFAEMAWSLAQGTETSGVWWKLHVFYSVIFITLAVIAYRRDEGMRFG